MRKVAIFIMYLTYIYVYIYAVTFKKINKFWWSRGDINSYVDRSTLPVTLSRDLCLHEGNIFKKNKL